MKKKTISYKLNNNNNVTSYFNILRQIKTFFQAKLIKL